MNDISGFRKAHITSSEVSSILKKNNEKKVFTGISVIDDVFGGVKTSDVVLLGAATGVGKTALVSQIAVRVARQGKRVYMYALEAEDREIEMRILFSQIASKSKEKLYYKKWYDNHYKDLATQEAIGELHLDNLNIYYRKKEFTAKDFVRSTMAIKEKADLIIVDHIHYFDLEGADELRELSKAIRMIRDIALLTNIPIIIVAHLRKEVAQSSGEKKLMPTLDDFFGSSDLSKVCTKAIMLSQVRTKGAEGTTFFHFPKFRQFGSAKNYLFSCKYNINTNTYDDKYKVFYFEHNTESLLLSLSPVQSSDLDWLG